jgi:tartrate-resistant acid phosphatase type 5
MRFTSFSGIRFFSRAILALLLLAGVCRAAEVDFLVFGDWGDNSPSQKAVAAQLVSYVRKQSVKFEAVLNLGDNFYVPLPGEIADPQWRTLFEDMYDPKALGFPFYTVLGNHDYESGKKEIELRYAREKPASRWKLPAPWYRLDLPAAHPLVTILALDSNWKLLTSAEWKEQLAWMEIELPKPRATKWLVCMAHHPLFSNAEHGSDERLQTDWGALFKKYRVDFYLAGHEHTLQHLQPANHPTTFIVSGGGGRQLHKVLSHALGPFSRSVFGFVDLRFTEQNATAAFIDKEGAVLHQLLRDRAGAVSDRNGIAP